jgi:hypothetical protein
MRLGPKNPPVDATALMSAIAAAAAVPLKSMVGRHQKVGAKTAPPIGISASAAIRSVGLGAMAAPRQPLEARKFKMYSVQRE